MKNVITLVPEAVSHDLLSFLTNSLGTEHFQLVPLAGDASSRRYYRVILNDQSWVLMEWEPFVNNNQYPFLSVLNHFSKNAIQVPYVKSVSGKDGLVLLEDLGDLTLERKFWESQSQDKAIPFYYQAVDELLKIHYTATSDRTDECTAFGIAFDTAKFLWEMNYGKEHLIEKLGKMHLSPLVEKELQRVFFEICSLLDKRPKFISHRDYHSRNLMIKLGKMRVIDFQDARLGPIQYDLVSLLHDSYVDLDKSSMEKVLQYYLTRCRDDYGQSISRDEFDEVFRLQSVQRCFKACGSFSSFYNIRGDTRYLKYIHHTINTVLDYLDFFPEYQSFKLLLGDSQLSQMDFEKI
ncbi:MAG: phosphotransferase [Bdellovibrionales bacterium]|nr:phosphotransferase [Bdellovibrionales bacterium]